MYPDRDYRLDLRRWDHREMVKILVKLASAEPGDNWLNVSYRWAKYDEPVPGMITFIFKKNSIHCCCCC